MTTDRAKSPSSSSLRNMLIAFNPNVDAEDTTDYNHHLMDVVQRVPMVVKTAVGSTLVNGDGKRHLDYWGDEGVCALGYNSKPYLEAVESFIETGAPHQLPDVYPHEIRWEAAAMLAERSGMDKVFFANSGTEANEAAIKLARKYWWDRSGCAHQKHGTNAPVHARHRILTIAGNFHGRTGLSLAASDPRVSPYHRHGFGPIAKGFDVIEWRPERSGALAFQRAVVDGVELPVWEDVPWHEVSGIILAPVLGNNLVKTYPSQFWEALDAVRAETGALLIYDDVQAGMGRAGALATWRLHGVKPDIMCLGKGIAMGHPMSACLATAEVATAFTPGVHFNTFGGSPFACWMACKMVQWLDDHQSEVNEKGKFIRGEFARRDWILHHDGSGMLNAFQPDFDKHGYNGYDFIKEARAQGLSLMTHRPKGMIRFTPPLTVHWGELTQAFSILDSTHQELEFQARRRAEVQP